MTKDARTANRFQAADANGVFFFFSNQLGCVGSILVSVVLTVIIVLLLRGCHG